MVKVSIIVPVYDSRDYIIPCVESLISQTLDEIEILLVDDHGTDDSIAAVRNYLEASAVRKPFVFLETPVNSGPGAARNLGIEAATGEYVAFVDSDDWIDREFCESIYKAASRKDADIAFCHLFQDNIREGHSVELRNPRVSSGVFSQKDHKLFLSRFVSYFTTFLYRREFLISNDLRFPQTSSSEDSCFLASCVLAAQRIASVDKPLYHYVKHIHSLSNKVDPTKYRQKLNSFDAFFDYAKSKGYYETYKDEIDFIFIKKAFLMAAKTYVSNEPQPDPAMLQELHGIMSQHVPDYVANPYLKKDLKVKALTRWIEKHPRFALRVLGMSW